MNFLSFARHGNAELIDRYYAEWLQSPSALPPLWQAFFEGFALASARPSCPALPPATGAAAPDSSAEQAAMMQARVTGAIYAYRSIGHTQAAFNPLNPPQPNPRLDLERLGFSPEDLDRPFHTGNYLGGQMLPLGEILANLNETYCGPVGCEYLHIQETSRRRWLQSRIEPNRFRPDFSRERRLYILKAISRAELFENFLHTRYVGQKRFSLEGAETTIAALDSIVALAPLLGLQRIILGMAHRGRLNVLANILDKSLEFIFREFSENYIPDAHHGDGDVKYHLGYETTHTTPSGRTVTVELIPNPSHLEAVNPVVLGQARAWQEKLGDTSRRSVLPILIHGDAAIAGQGIVAETLNLSGLNGYRTGGTFHFVINNQIGFTTDPRDSRSGSYCTDIARTIEAPIFHVNGDDPLAVVHVTELALQYRQEFGSDVVIDMYCYRRHGHNETDEPAFTQPALYRRLASHPLISRQLAERLVAAGDLTAEEAEGLRAEYSGKLDAAFQHLQKHPELYSGQATLSRLGRFDGSTATFQAPYDFIPVKTSVAPALLEKVAQGLTHLPEGFNANPKVLRQLQARKKAFDEGKGIDWGFGEALAFGTLLLQGHPVRLSGQDSARGTFSHRHAVLHDAESGSPYCPLANLAPNQAPFAVHNSSLSEAAVLGFDFGWSQVLPEALCLWEAQFGDFGNGAQVIIDQFICSCESKWQCLSGLVMLLPHGYEGQGPEHSSARLERYLQACAENNIQVCNVTTPAQYFHALRRQLIRKFRKPLILMAPKSLLRHPECVSSLKDFTHGQFKCILEDPEPAKKPERVILCTGKVYYDLLSFRRNNNIKDTNILRIEQLYPLDQEHLQAILEKQGAFNRLVWCQEEPQNMGAWTFLAPALEKYSGGRRPVYAGRRAAASPATGSLARHRREQASLVEAAFGI